MCAFGEAGWSGEGAARPSALATVQELERSPDDPCCAAGTPHRRGGDRRLISRSLGAALLSSACCTVPVALAAAGLGVVSGLAGLLPFAPLAGLVLLAALIRRELRSRGDAPSDPDRLRQSRRRIFRAVVAFGATWVVMTSVVTPLVGAALAGGGSRAAPRGGGDVEGMAARPAGLRRLELDIAGMYCPACVYTVQARLGRLPGVFDLEVWMGGASLSYDPAVIGAEQIREAASFYVYRATIDPDPAGQR